MPIEDLFIQFSLVTQSCPTLCEPMNRSTPGLPVHHHLPKFTQTHVHRVGDAIQLGFLRGSLPCLCPWGLNPHQGETQALLIVSCSCSLPPDPSLGISLNPKRDLSSSWRAGNRLHVNFMSSPLQGLQLNILYPETTQPVILNN